jgi:Ca2+-binding RTX toxin-like protein
LWNFRHLGTIQDVRIGSLTPSIQIFAVPVGQNWTINVADFGWGVTTHLAASINQVPTFLSRASHAAGTTPIVVSGYAGNLLDAVLDAALLPGSYGSISAYLSPLADYDSKVEVVAVNVGFETFLFSAARTAAGLSVYEPRADGSLNWITDLADTTTTYASGISAMAAVKTNGQSFLFVGSETEHGVTGYSVAAGGILSPISSLGVDQLIPVQNVSGLCAVNAGGNNFLVMAASGSSSLTVFSVAADGSLTTVDHIVDDLTTRFQSVTVLEVIVVNGRVIVAAAGADQGISFFTLLPNGSLLHLQNVVDNSIYSLSSVSALELIQMGSTVQVVVTSAIDPGISVFEIRLQNLGVTDFGPGALTAATGNDDMLAVLSGANTLSGGAGDDILMDGSGNDELIGGAGRDIFVQIYDGQHDIIRDFQIGLDRIDLSLFPYLRSIQQLAITAISGGAVVTYLNERLTVYTADGRSLTSTDFDIFDLVRLTRFPVSAGVPEINPFVEDPGFPVPPNPPPGYVLRQGSQTADILTGTSANEQLRAFAGDDEMVGGGGTDHFYGGSGFDTVSYIDENTMVKIDLLDPTLNAGAAAGEILDSVEGITGTAYNDRIYAGDESNLIDGDAGHDFLDVRGGDDTIHGGAGNDAILGRDGNDLLLGEGGDDNIAASDGNDTVYGGAGNDQIGGGEGNDLLYGGDDNDVLGSGNGHDLIFADAGNDIASGGWGSDTLHGGIGDDTLAGSFGHDLVTGGDGNDSIGGGDGDDTIQAGPGDDQIGGGSGDDVLYGGNGHDFIGSSDGDDQLWGNLGNDTLNGGFGDDSMDGGGGSDTFVFNHLQSGEIDTIYGFEPGLDVIRISGVSGQTQAERFSALSLTSNGSGANTDIQISYDGHLIILSLPGLGTLGLDSFVFL